MSKIRLAFHESRSLRIGFHATAFFRNESNLHGTRTKWIYILVLEGSFFFSVKKIGETWFFRTRLPRNEFRYDDGIETDLRIRIKKNMMRMWRWNKIQRWCHRLILASTDLRIRSCRFESRLAGREQTRISKGLASKTIWSHR